LIVSSQTVDALVQNSWNAVRDKVENGDNLSSEKTLVFLFAMEITHRVGKNLKIDFENQCYSNLQGSSRYLDLLFYTDENYKVAIEFKLPRKSAGGASNQPETREAIYRDIGRLHYLKNNTIKPKACFFLMAINEPAYLNTGNYKRSPNLITSHGHEINPNNNIQIDGVSLNGVQAIFNWRGIVTQNDRFICEGLYSWLDPIRV